jgi:hypothetical protein
MANIVYCNNLCKNNHYYTLATEFVPNPPPMLPAHHTGIADSGSNWHYFAPDAPVANYNPQAPTVGVCVANGHSKCLVASATLASATALRQLCRGMSCLTSTIPSSACDHLPTMTA